MYVDKLHDVRLLSFSFANISVPPYLAWVVNMIHIVFGLAKRLLCDYSQL